MGSFNASLNLNGVLFTVSSCEYSLYQPTDSRGKTTASVKSGLIKLTLVAETQNQHLTLSNWISAVNDPKDGTIKFSKIDGIDSTYKDVSFEKGHCVSYREVFTPYAGVSSSLTVTIGITAEIIHIGSATHDNLWAEKYKS